MKAESLQRTVKEFLLCVAPKVRHYAIRKKYAMYSSMKKSINKIKYAQILRNFSAFK